MEWLNYAKRAQLKYKLARTHLEPTEYGLFVYGSYGDVVVTFSLLQSFYTVHGNRICTFLDESYAPLFDAYKAEWLRPIFLKHPRELANILMSTGDVHFLEQGFIYPTLVTEHPLIAEAILTNRITDIQARKLVLRLPRDAQISPFRPTPQRSMKLQHDLIGICPPNDKLILLSLNTNTTQGLSLDEAESLITHIRSFGWDVVLNIAQGDKYSSLNDMVKLISIPPDAPIIFTEYFRRHIIITSGLLTVLSIFKHEGHILHLIDNRQKVSLNNLIEIPTEDYSIRNGRWELADNHITEIFFDRIDTILSERINDWARSS